MDPFIANLLVVFGTLAVAAPVGAWLLPKMDRAADRVEAWLDARKAR